MGNASLPMATSGLTQSTLIGEFDLQGNQGVRPARYRVLGIHDPTPAAQAEQSKDQYCQTPGPPKGSGQQAHGAMVLVAIMTECAKNKQHQHCQNQTATPLQPETLLHLSAPPLISLTIL